MKIDFSRKVKNPIERLRNSVQEPLLIIYDVLGHFAKPRDHLSKSFCSNLNARAKNGFLFSQEKDLVMTSSKLDINHWQWLKSVNIGKGDLFFVEQMSEDEEESFFEFFLRQNRTAYLIELLKQRQICKIFSWMNSQNEVTFASQNNLEFAWTCPFSLVQEHFDKILFKEKVRNLHLPVIDFFTFQTPNEDRKKWQSKIKMNFANYLPEKKLIAKPSSSAAGSGIFTFQVKDQNHAYEKIISLESNLWLIEEYFEECRSVNIQIFISDTHQLDFFGVSEQLLQGFSYRGNHGSPQSCNDQGMAECFVQSQVIAHDIAKQGYRGLIGLDFVITPKNEVRVLENNIRLNGSTFSLCLVAEIEKTLGKQIFWRFEKLFFESSISFVRIYESNKEILYSSQVPLLAGIFIQEYASSERGTELAVISWATSKTQLEDVILQFKLNIGLH
ncbi:MAG: ATP-grasp domain-containing protein [Bdellovibrionaceae bacterium]|nr:ATP-grasp domain-containing protein [Pseudobdellovibrionaceae bacterium]NUM58782.1 ATP-grasp domain-containing protein [Pseudobdellovibrionaceae bacterium]